MDTNALRLLLSVARHGSLAATARAENIDPSTVSRTVAQAEARLGLRLFQRDTRNLTPTEAGRRYLAAIETPLRALDDARETARSQDGRIAGTVRLSASVAYGTRALVPRLPDLMARHPDLNLDLILDDAPRDLVGDGIDLALRLTPAPKGDLISRRLAPVRYRLVAAPGTPTLPDPAALDTARCLIHDHPGLQPLWQFRQGDIQHDIPVTGRLRMTSPLALREAALRGLGPALLADWLIQDDLTQGHLSDILPGWHGALQGFDTALWLLYPSRAGLPRRTRATIDWFTASAPEPANP
ncbi:MAG: LysR family transcriptional regulator [Pseudomonadota bacterium]